MDYVIKIWGYMKFLMVTFENFDILRHLGGPNRGFLSKIEFFPRHILKVKMFWELFENLYECDKRFS